MRVDPVDTIINRSNASAARTLHEAGFTANGVTLVSILFSAVALWGMYHRNVWVFLCGAILAYLFDCWDGAVARTYDETSEFGEKLDHFSDLAFCVGIILVLIVRLRAHRSHPVLLAILAVGAVLLLMNRACSVSPDDGVMGMLAPLCPSPHAEPVLWWFGPGTFQVILLAAISVVLVERKRSS